MAAILAEVNSTFGESRNYWLSSANQVGANALRFRCPKTMHVSPFMGMDLTYDFVLTPPANRLVVHMSTLDGATAAEGALFDATLTLERRDWTAAELRRGLLRHPWMSAT